MNPTSLAFVSLGLGLVFCGFRFLRAFRNVKRRDIDQVGLLLSMFFFGFAFQNGFILGLGTLVFPQNSVGLYWVSLIANIFLVGLAMLGIYTAYYIFWPKHFSSLSYLVLFSIGLFSTLVAIRTQPRPFITSSGGIDWNMSFPLSLLTFLLLFASIAPSLYIFARLFPTVKTRELKVLCVVLIILSVIGIIDAFLRFIIFHNLTSDVRTKIYDSIQALVGMGFIIAFAVVPTLTNRSKNQN